MFALISPNLSEFIGRLGVFSEVITGVVSMTGAFRLIEGYKINVVIPYSVTLAVEIRIFKP